jgi:anti-sigma regulatory factor (Ser/Thr protein kinase)
MKGEFFRISSGLKDLIGGQLITDKFAAVFELVKNSFDAGASEVIIKFENIYTGNSKIIIIDNGKGMDYEDIKDKWLFVAYSAKKDGTEDTQDYRSNLKGNKHYAGAKGVGRFSCDRLGRFLNLYSIKIKNTSQIEHIKVDWREFEKNLKIEFGKIPIERNNPIKIPYKIKHGTVLEISDIVTEDWNREALIDLKDKLSKLIRPKLSDRIKDKRLFNIVLEAKEEVEGDNEEAKKYKKEGIGKIYKRTVNGEIKNFIFEDLDIKTTKIITEIINEGKEIKTTLIDRNTEIYSVTEKNSFKYLYNVSVNLYFLNQASKSIFSKKIGEQPINYGNVFVYKNGFRIYPFGEPRDDSMGIDARGTQGYARYLQTRNLIGQIEVYQENDHLIESTSRDGGFIKNKAFSELKEFFFEKNLKRLEKYVVEVAEWGVDDGSLKELTEGNIHQNLVKFISNISTDDSIIDLTYNDKIIKLIDAQEEKSAKKIIKNFKRIASETKNKKLLSDAKRLEKKFENFKGLNKENIVLTNLKEKVEKELEKKSEQLAIATSIESQDLSNVTNLHHQVFVISDTIKSILKEFSIKIANGEKISQVELKELLDELTLENSKIESISKFGMRAIFEDFNSIKKKDIIGFFESYVDKISNYFKTNKIKVDFKSLNNTFNASFRPLDISIIIDNMINNAKKHKATSLTIQTEILNDKQLQISFKDNGIGISNEIKEINKIFEKGFSTTNSTGLGLYHINNIIKSYKWEIAVNVKNPKGAEFIIKID